MQANKSKYQMMSHWKMYQCLHSFLILFLVHLTAHSFMYLWRHLFICFWFWRFQSSIEAGSRWELKLHKASEVAENMWGCRKHQKPDWFLYQKSRCYYNSSVSCVLHRGIQKKALMHHTQIHQSSSSAVRRTCSQKICWTECWMDI